MVCVVDVFGSAAWEQINNTWPDFEFEQIIMSFGRVLDSSTWQVQNTVFVHYFGGKICKQLEKK